MISMTKSGLVAPIVHLNGSSKADLLKHYQEAYQALHDAQVMVQTTWPHARDYYVSSDPDATRKAVEQHNSRIQRISVVLEELKELYDAVDNQGNKP